jgi:AsmA protein
MRALKIAGFVAGGLIALIVLALVAVLIFVDPNDFRDDIERIVERETGRELTLAGDLKLSVFPWIALELGAASLGDAPGFGDEPFVSIEEARVGAKLLPLLRGKMEIGEVRLVGARIRLITDEQGRNNWADLGEQKEGDTPSADDATSELPTIAGLEIRDAAITIEDRKERTRQVVRDFNLKTGRLVSGEPFDFETQFVFDQLPEMAVAVDMAAKVTADLERNAHQLQKPQIDLKITGQGYPADGIPVEVRASSLQADIGQELYRLVDLAVSTTWKGEGYPPSGVPIQLKAQDLSANLAKQTLELNGLDTTVAGARITGSLSGEEIVDAPRLNGPLQLEPVSLREWLPKLGIDLPQTADPEVLKRLSFSSRVAVTKTSADLQNLVMQLDDTTAKGSFGVADFDAMALRFDLNIDRINADRYLSPATEEPVEKGETPPTEIPVDTLRELNARGQITVDEAIFSGMTFTKLRLGVNARDGKVRFHPSEASMYGGRYQGDISIDATGQVARVSLNEQVTGIDFAPLFRDFFETNRVSGKGNLRLKLTGAGKTTDDIMKTLDGTLDFNVADGALEGADLWYEIRRARAVLKQSAVPERPAGSPRTPFTALSGTGTMSNGVLTNKDLNVAMQYLRITGEGTVDVPKSALDYRLMATVLKIPREGAEGEMQDLVDAQIPVKVTGALTDPKVRPDLEGYLKGKVQERVDEERKKLEEKAKDKIGEKLKDLFGR